MKKNNPKGNGPRRKIKKDEMTKLARQAHGQKQGNTRQYQGRASKPEKAK